MRALQLSGITVLDNDGSTLQPGAAPGAGIKIDRWEVVTLGMFAQNPVAERLSDFSDMITTKLPGLAGQPLGDWILDGLRTMAVSSKPQARFFARFIVELGRQQAFSPDDILGTATPDDVVLDGVAVELLLRRLAADVWAYAVSIHAGPVPFAPATATPDASSTSTSIQLDAETTQPCSINETAGKILDATAVGFTTAFDKLTEYFIEHSKSLSGTSALESLKNFGAAANILLAVGKLIAYYASLRVKIEMQAAPPLKRTKTTKAGEMKTLVVTAYMDVPTYLQMINCFRIMLNALGMDVSMPNSGKLANSDANWLIAQGGGANGIIRFTRADPNNPASGDPIHQHTDENGQASIGLEGVPQKKDLPESSPPVNKAGEVWVTVQPKPPSFSQDALDALVGVSPGLGLIGVVPVEMLLRSNLLKPAELPFTVIDWGAEMFRLDFTSTVTGGVPAHFMLTMNINGMILGDPSQGNAVPGDNGKNNIVLGAHDVDYTIKFNGFCATNNGIPIDPMQTGTITQGPPAEAALFYDTSPTGDPTNLRLTLFPGMPREQLICPKDGQYPGTTSLTAQWLLVMGVLHDSGPCPGTPIAGNSTYVMGYVHICGFLSIGPGVWQRTFSGPGNKADYPAKNPVPAPPRLNATEQTTVTITDITNNP